MIIAAIDGSCRPKNPGGVATFGFVIKRDSWRVHADNGFIGEGPEMSNNVAEYSALCRVLEWLWKHGLDQHRIAILSDSQMLVKQMRREWQAQDGLYFPYYERAQMWAEQFPHLSFELIPRNQNREADHLSRAAYNRYIQNRGDI